MNNEFKNAGLFIHWGVSTENENWEQQIPKYSSFEEFEDYVNEGNWNPSKWINAARKIHATYMTLACFHGALGYMKAWKSKIPGTYTTKRDYLGELIAEGAKYGIKVVVYISAHPKNARFYPGQLWIDKKAYSDYKGKDIDIEDWDIWQTVYCKDVISELIDNYPGIGGFWFDGWFRKRNAEELFAYIKKKKPSVMIIRNNFGHDEYENEDLMSVEDFGKVTEPDYDFASSYWQDKKITECCYRMMEVSDWWYYKELPPFDPNILVKRYISIAANGWIPKVGIGPLASGDMPANGVSFLNKCEEYLSWAEESVFNIERGTLPMGYINDNGYVITTKRDKIHYVHILTIPDSDKIVLQDGGMDFSKAVNLKTNQELSFKQDNGKLVFDNNFDEDCDIVIKLTEEKQRTIKEFKIDKEDDLPVSLKLELDNKTDISGIIIKQKQNSAQHGGSWAAVDNNRLKSYMIYKKEDGEKKLIAEGKLNGVRGMVQIDFTTKAKKLEIVLNSSYKETDGEIFKFVSADDGWKTIGYNNVKSYAKNGCCEYIVSNDGKLILSENKSEKVLEYNVQRVFLGENKVIYYIDKKNNIRTTAGEKTGFTGQKAAVDENGDFYTISENKLYKNGKEIDDGVNDVTAYGSSVDYCKDHSIYSLKDNSVTEYDYDIKAIGKNCMLLKDGSLLLRDCYGKDDTYYYNDVADIFDSADGIYAIKGATKGKCRVESIRLI